MKFAARRCTWYFHWWPMIYVGWYDFNRGRGVLVDWLGFTVEVDFSGR